MTDASAIRHLTEYEDDDELDEKEDRTPDDRVEFDLYYDSTHVQPWAKGPNEAVRLYFNDDERNDAYVPVTFAEQIESDIRSSPLGEPTNDAEESWADLPGQTELEEGVDVEGVEFDLLRLYEDGDDDGTVIAAAEFADRS